MVSINPTSPIVTPSSNSTDRQVAPATATGRRDRSVATSNERRRHPERRGRRGSQQLMDRRLADRRRSRIDVSV
jgi:hypothetical protein